MKTYTFICLLCIALLSPGCEEETIDVSGEGNLTGRVVSSGENTPLENVKISTNPVTTTVFTDAEGNFAIENISIGEYSVQAELEDFVTAFEAANVIEGETVNVVFELDSVSAKNLVPLKPVLLSPADKEEGLSTDITFVWSSSANDDDDIEYTLTLRNGLTNEEQVFEKLTDTTTTVSNLGIGVNYFWQVKADDGVNETVSSDIAGFTTLDISANRVLFTRNIDGNNVIYSAPDAQAAQEGEEKVYRLTSSDRNSFRPRKNNTAGKIAFLRTVGAETHLFTMNTDGSSVRQLTGSIPVAGFRQEELDFAWYDNGAKIYYPNFDKLYSINADGSGTSLVYQSPTGAFITEVATNEVNDQIVIRTNNSNGYNARIVVLDPNTGTESAVVEENVSGALGGLDFSIAGSKVLYTRDVSGIENDQYRQLDTRIFEYDLTAMTTTELVTEKASGTLDLDPSYSPDDGAIIYTNTSNDGISSRFIYKLVFDTEFNRELLFENAFMPDWE
ncbi:carboxypeptidase-like regulatory domain-containing protein [Robertkochia aurantiaca]|uniref:carboxypeptidase-like regulatory domain-containing protein n=1 Tax=Robertkochia aurantiaca TaxID=2873700 RepID=UPI001CCF44A2|nr:carboxypeptidase-like regulatory domain-containing protein [Robertkochia sp. 3YJGBD-33]